MNIRFVVTPIVLVIEILACMDRKKRKLKLLRLLKITLALLRPRHAHSVTLGTDTL